MKTDGENYNIRKDTTFCMQIMIL